MLGNLVYLNLLVFGYIALRLILPLRLTIRARIMLCLIAAAMLSRGYLHLFMHRPIFDLGLPRLLTALLAGFYSAMVALFLLTLLRDLINLICKLIIRRRSAAVLPSSSPALAALMGGSMAGLFLYAAFNAFSAPQFVQMEVRIKGLPPAAENLSVAFLADTHVNYMSRRDDVAAYVNAVNELRPDLAVIAGDLQDGTPGTVGAVAAELTRLRAPLGVYACEGNHEFYWGTEVWEDFYTSRGMVFLDDESVTISRDGTPLFTLAGVRDTASFTIAGSTPADLPPSAKDNAADATVRQVLADAGSDLPIILLSHRPGRADAADGKAALVLSGHTHGGMMVGLDRIVAKFNHGYVSGRYHLPGGTELIVSNGTSLWQGFALRLGVPPQIIMLTLKAAENAAATPDAGGTAAESTRQ